MLNESERYKRRSVTDVCRSILNGFGERNRGTCGERLLADGILLWTAMLLLAGSEASSKLPPQMHCDDDFDPIMAQHIAQKHGKCRKRHAEDE